MVFSDQKKKKKVNRSHQLYCFFLLFQLVWKTGFKLSMFLINHEKRCDITQVHVLRGFAGWRCDDIVTSVSYSNVFY